MLALEISPSGFLIISPFGDTLELDTLQQNADLTIEPWPLDPVTFAPDFDRGRQPLRPGASIPVDVVSSSPSVAAVTDSPVTVSAATQNGFPTQAFTELDPLTAGSTTIEALAPTGFAAPSSGHQKFVTVDAPDLLFQSGGGNVGRDLQSTGLVILETTPPEPVEITITSSSPAIATVSDAVDQVGGGSVTFQVVPGMSSIRFWVEGRSLGTTQFTAQAPGYDDGVLVVRVEPSGFVHASQADVRVPVSTPPFERNVVAARLAPTTLAFVEQQSLRPGLSVDVTVTSSDPAVVGVLGSPTTIAHQSNGSYDLEPRAVGSAVVTVEAPPGFDAPSDRGTVSVIIDP